MKIDKKKKKVPVTSPENNKRIQRNNAVKYLASSFIIGIWNLLLLH